MVDGVGRGPRPLLPADEPGAPALSVGSTRPGAGAGSAPGCWSTRAGWRNSASAPTRWCLTTSVRATTAVLPMVLAAGLRGRIRMAGDELTVRVPVRDLRPLRA